MEREQTKLAVQISSKVTPAYSNFISLFHQLHWILEPIQDKSNLQQSTKNGGGS